MNTPKHVSRRNFLGGAALLAGFAATSMTGCSAGGAGGARKAGGLQIMSLSNEITQEVIDAWSAEHPDIPLTLIPDDPTRLNSMLAAGTPPDLIRGLGATGTPNVASRGLALDLDPFIAQSSLLKESGLAKINDVWRWDGSRQGDGARYGLVKDWSQDSMFWYNAEAFGQAGIPAPTADKPFTYDQLLEYAGAMTTRGGGKVQQYGLFTTTPSIEAISSMMATAGGRVFNDDLTQSDFSSPEARRALQWYVDVAKAKVGYTLTDPNPDGWDWPPFDAKRLAMAGPAGYWFGGAVSQNPATGEFARLAPAPMMGSKRVSPTTAATGYWISSKSTMKDEAFAFLEWYCAGAPAKARAQSGWGLPAVTSLTSELPAAKPYQVEALAIQRNEEQYFEIISFSPYAQATAVSAAIANLFPRTVAGELSTGQFADQATAAVNELLQQGLQLAGKKG